MAIDFELLSMTDLRSRPGEILDRVADDGRVFVIEKNGRRKACLVPLSIFFPDIPPARIATELELLHASGEKPRTSITDKHELMFRFPTELANGPDCPLEILLPHGYPNVCPRAYAPTINHDAPHRWADGSLCLFGVMGSWNPGTHTVLSTLNLARRWLRSYHSWVNAGRWPEIEEPRDE